MKKILVALFFLSFSFSLNTNSEATASTFITNPIPPIQALCYNYSVTAADMEWNWLYTTNPDHDDEIWSSMQLNYMIMCIRSVKKGEEILLPVFIDL